MPQQAAMDAASLRELAEATTVAEVMHRDVVCLSMDARIDAVVEMFLDKDLSSAPVVDAAWRPLGMLSKTDLLALYDGQSDSAASGKTQVGHIALPHVISVHQDASLSVAAALMANEGVHCLPIVAGGGEVVGIVSTLDVIRWLARSTGMQVGEER
jgi:CBS domain-containing protein